MAKKHYMHLLEGRPAEYHDSHGPMICFAGRSVKKLADSLKQIRREQRMAMDEARRGGGNQLEWTDPSLYDYTIIYVD